MKSPEIIKKIPEQNHTESVRVSDKKKVDVVKKVSEQKEHLVSSLILILL